ncbi:MAG: alkaline phosphatase PhoX [Geitlerinemataceae cyanobacterium]
MTVKRRHFLVFLGGTAGAIALSSLHSCGTDRRPVSTQSPTPNVPFRPIRGAMPLATDGLSGNAQIEAYQTYEVVDDVVLPEEFEYYVIGSWGEAIGNSRFGYNNDYLSFVESGENAGYLTINFEYISAGVWMQTYTPVLGKSLPFAEVATQLKKNPINAFALPKENPLKAKIGQICQEALIDQGLGVIALKRDEKGQWVRQPGTIDRRVTGISGLTDGRYLKATGPAAAVFRKAKGDGYLDGLGDRIIGTFGNCAGGTTPWGTVLSGEENFQSQVPEAVYRDGTSADPSQLPFYIDEGKLSGQGNVFGLAGNKYGWIVEIDPANPQDYGTKHTWLGRYRHEAVGVRVEVGKQLAFYSGCDRRSGHLYKFVSRNAVTNPTDKANSQLLSDGTLYAAKFNADGTGSWLPLAASTPVNPDSPSDNFGNVLLLPPTDKSSYLKADGEKQIQDFKQKYKTLGNIYTGTPEEQQGAILIDAHYAANAIGATCTARPEDTEIAPDGSLYIAFTSGLPDKEEGGPDKRIFKSPQGDAAYEFGWIMQLVETDNNPAATTFTWEMAATGGEPSAGGAGFANPDNVLLDAKGNVWMVTDMSAKNMNTAVASRTDEKGEPIDPSNFSGVFGNNAMWFLPGDGDGKAYLFATGPMECEMTGPFFSGDGKTLFLAIQHPGEANGTCKNGARETRELAMLTPTGEAFQQQRICPIGSNWPSRVTDGLPKPAVVAIYRKDRGTIV